jgi:hypothetical protein
MKKTILLTTLLFVMFCGFAQTTTKTEASKKEDTKKHISVTVSTDGKTTTIDTVITTGDTSTPVHLKKMLHDKKGIHRIVVKMDSINGETVLSDIEFQPMDKGQRIKMMQKIKKDMKTMKDSMPLIDFDFPDMDVLKDFNFNGPKGPMHIKLRGLPGMNGRLHKVEDEEFARLREKGILTDKEDLAEKLDIRFVNTSPCGEDCQILNFVSKEKGKINIALIEQEGKIVDKTEAGIVSSKEVDGRNVFSCVINIGKDKKFTFIKLTKDGKLALFSNGF